jgi:hypothetical protein
MTFCEKTLLKRFPQFELSYETISHNKVPSDKYEIALAIPQGRKYYAWFSFCDNRDVCYLMELTRDKKIGKITTANFSSTTQLSLGSIFYGTITEGDVPIFVIEDVLYYKGVCVKQHVFSMKLGMLEDLFLHMPLQKTQDLHFRLPMLWKNGGNESFDECGYQIHHLQYRRLFSIVPYMNLSTKMKQVETKPVAELVTLRVTHQMDFHKPQYKFPTVFMVNADVQFDIYHLYAYGQNKSQVYCGVAGIPTYKTSIFMNGIFRKIRENQNLDYIEESDDEDDFENTDFSKYVDLQKSVLMECTFHNKFKKWVPRRIVPANGQVVHIHKLAK